MSGQQQLQGQTRRSKVKVSQVHADFDAGSKEKKLTNRPAVRLDPLGETGKKKSEKKSIEMSFVAAGIGKRDGMAKFVL